MQFTVKLNLFCVIAMLILPGCASNRSGSYSSNTRTATSRPYTIKGVTYHPQKHYNYDETGKASFYGDGDGFHGKKTATGETYDAYAMTAAHKTLPLPAVVEVTNLSNGKKVKLKVNDRGPFVKGRIIDVSTAAAKKLGFYKQGVTPVRVRLLVAETKKINGDAGYWQHAVYHQESDVPIRDMMPHNAIREGKPANQKPSYMAYGYAKPNVSPKRPDEIYVTQAVASTTIPGHYIQAGVFSNSDNAQALKNNLERNVPSALISIQNHPYKPLKLVRIGPFTSAIEAQKHLEHFKKYGYEDFYILQN